MREINKLIQWLKRKENYPYIVVFLVGFGVTIYKYSFKAAIIVFSIAILFGFIMGLIIRKFFK